MNFKIDKYDSDSHLKGLQELIISEGEEWAHYVQEPGAEKYVQALKESITLVATIDGKVCGYARSITDFGLFIWVIDLLVQKEFRWNEIGKNLFERLKKDHPDQDVYVLSDVDEYYEKLGFVKEGSVYKVA